MESPALEEPTVTQELFVGGIGVTVVLPARSLWQQHQPCAVLFLLHGRKESPAKYLEYAKQLVTESIGADGADGAGAGARHMLAVALFEQRNHGGRLVHAPANDAWSDGNAAHACDMFAMQLGTSRDVSFLIDTLPMYLRLPPHSHVTRWGVAGISLGGHATLLTVAHEPRISVAVSVIGCGDYLALMIPRATSWDLPVPPSSHEFITKELLAAVATLDPVNRIASLGSQKLLLLNGGKDKLVPAKANERYIELAKERFEASGNSDGFQVVIDEDAKHAFSPAMRTKAAEWIIQHLVQ